MIMEIALGLIIGVAGFILGIQYGEAFSQWYYYWIKDLPYTLRLKKRPKSTLTQGAFNQLFKPGLRKDFEEAFTAQWDAQYMNDPEKEK